MISSRLRRDALVVIAGASAIVAAFRIGEMLLIPDYLTSVIGTDLRWYLEQTQRWQHDGSWYLPFQLTGPYDLTQGVLYPPSALVLFLPFTILPAFMWWLIPVGVTTAIVISLRPAAWGLALIGACLAFPMSITHLVNGNPVMWITMLVALGTRWPWVGALIAATKPSLAPFALLGIRSRAWWLVVAAMTAANLLILPFWLDYLRALSNLSGSQASILYSVKDVPLVIIPLVAAAATAGHAGRPPDRLT